MNSFRSVERAIGFEIDRQTRALDAGEPLVQETRGWDDDRGVTYRMRVKESSDDYRYFPEPDLPPLRVDAAWLESIRTTMPELPSARRERYVTELGLAPADAVVIVGDPAAAQVFEGAMDAVGGSVPGRKVANWVTGEYLRLAKGEGGTAAVARVDPARAGPARAHGRGRGAVGHQRQGGVRAARCDRPAGGRTGRRGRLHAHQRHRRAADRGAGGDRRQPCRRRRRPGGQGAGDRVPDGAGHEADAWPGGRRDRRRAAARAARHSAERGDAVLLNVILWIAGLALLALGIWQVRQPLAHYRSLEATQANLRRYDDWRGGKLIDDSARTGADEMRDLLRNRIRLWVVVIIVGIVLLVAGFIVR